MIFLYKNRYDIKLILIDLIMVSFFIFFPNVIVILFSKVFGYLSGPVCDVGLIMFIYFIFVFLFFTFVNIFRMKNHQSSCSIMDLVFVAVFIFAAANETWFASKYLNISCHSYVESLRLMALNINAKSTLFVIWSYSCSWISASFFLILLRWRYV
ncbi:hypothetical protein [Iodobacter fluviatilis]|uniref:Uncharacterized protein n=1 Tax=Iodobacter fluviatilis TaxID=537 RepID=A0A7G3G542_9NEIS|nr:hypothetical protein [Iodobacter fluviatilis]QBC42391.1 hypothetical protein C1H71_01640 [Iodobacter fluviatilis]